MRQRAVNRFAATIRGVLIPKRLRVDRAVKRVLYGAIVKRQARSVGSGLCVNGYSHVTSNTVLADNVNFNGLEVSGQGAVSIGSNFHSGPQCLLITQFHNYDHGTALPYDATYVLKPIVIEDNVWLGSRVIILGGVTIGEGAIIQAGSVVVSDVPACGIAGGHPAKVFKSRDRDHYARLKQQGRFF